jgi:hypothetical protein
MSDAFEFRVFLLEWGAAGSCDWMAGAVEEGVAYWDGPRKTVWFPDVQPTPYGVCFLPDGDTTLVVPYPPEDAKAV